MLNMFILLTIIAGSFLCVSADHWGYPPESPNGIVEGTETWGGKCSAGRRQSPIDLAEGASILGRYPALVFFNYTVPILSGKVRNSGHSIQIDIPSNQKYLMAGGGLPGTYRMVQMHFHWASEHTINGKRYGLELHMVSHDTIYKNITEALKNKNGVAVLGVFFHVSDQPNFFLKNILDSTEPIKDGPGSSSPLKLPLAPGNLLPAKTTQFFRYEGSLTTPTCDEAVIWTVLTDSIPFEMHQIERFQQLKDDEGAELTHNFRLLQRLNSRPLIFVTDKKLVEDEDGNNASTRTTASASSLAMILFMLIFNTKLIL